MSSQKRKYLSTNINEVIRAVLNFLFFYVKILHAQKSTKRHKKHKKAKKAKKAKKVQKVQKAPKAQKAQKGNQAKVQNANKRTKIKNALKKHVSGKK